MAPLPTTALLFIAALVLYAVSLFAAYLLRPALRQASTWTLVGLYLLLPWLAAIVLFVVVALLSLTGQGDAAQALGLIAIYLVFLTAGGALVRALRRAPVQIDLLENGQMLISGEVWPLALGERAFSLRGDFDLRGQVPRRDGSRERLRLRARGASARIEGPRLQADGEIQFTKGDGLSAWSQHITLDLQERQVTLVGRALIQQGRDRHNRLQGDRFTIQLEENLIHAEEPRAQPVEGLPATLDAREFPGDWNTQLVNQIVRVLSTRAAGMTLVELGRALGLSWQRLTGAVGQLQRQGRIQKRREKYYLISSPPESGSKPK